jgi:hypothetical protein
MREPTRFDPALGKTFDVPPGLTPRDVEELVKQKLDGWRGFGFDFEGGCGRPVQRPKTSTEIPL